MLTGARAPLADVDLIDCVWLLALEFSAFTEAQQKRFVDLVDLLIADNRLTELDCYLHLDEEVLLACELIQSAPGFKRRQNRVRTKRL